ncbi:acetyltransferase (GNAT) family protein [Archangium gephyra]|uniref:Acetyltransferase (GNAT) family protein n=1 Tax=Archangium gephyra TaxID=48 RepID=A0ABX9KC28_9BACT|nr:GNAT family N-acetyltransferase [Archangium gephyra]REG37535.1 acetyltransferase (GNAT) family protein [Archangium gephyra]
MPTGDLETRAERLREVVETPRRAYLPLPDTQVIERPGWLQLLTPSLRQGGLNEVAYSALDEKEADAVIDETLEQYRRLGLRFRWTVGPDSRPADLAERLERRGMRRNETLGMIRGTSVPASAEGDITVEQVDEHTVEEYSRTMGEGWGMDPEPITAFNRLVLSHPGRRHRLFLARYRGVPAGTAGLVTFERSVYLLGGVVLPAFRGRGLYRALVTERLGYAAGRGIPFATIHARASTSAPLLERFGFETLCRFPIFTND